jgi:anti-anti-sigma factor
MLADVDGMVMHARGSTNGGGHPEEVLFRCAVELSGEVVVVRLRGELDLAGVGELDRLLEDAAVRRARRVVVDLRELRFVDSTGLRRLIGIREHLAPSAEVVFVPGPEAVQRVLSLTGFERVLTFVDDA